MMDKTPPAWMDEWALQVAKQFTGIGEPIRRARLQCTVLQAMQAAIDKPKVLVPYGWAISGSSYAFCGEDAEQYAKAEAKHVGGTCVAFPLYRITLSE